MLPLESRRDAMKGQGLLKAVIGQNPDDVAALTADIGTEKTKAAEAYAEIERLGQERRAAADFEAARAIDERIARCRWQIEHADAVIPELERRLSVAKAERQAEAIVRHHKAANRAYRKLRGAIDV